MTKQKLTAKQKADRIKAAEEREMRARAAEERAARTKKIFTIVVLSLIHI